MGISQPSAALSRRRRRRDAAAEARRLRRCAVAALALALAAGVAEAAISRAQPLAVRILLDNSGSMYPGYSPGSGRSISRLGVRLFREYPEFRQWLADFVARQQLLGGETVEMATFTSNRSFRPGEDVERIHDPVPLARFDASGALDKVNGYGLHTFLAESLDEYTRDFEGLVWLITDNIVETGEGDPDTGVEAFFSSLKEQARYRSVHLFKLPFSDPDHGHRSDLAIYGILVSPEEVPDAARFDRTFRDDFRQARRPGGGDLFPGKEHLKLKDLGIDALALEIPKTLQVKIAERENSLFRERQTVRLELPGVVTSHLTQHSVVGGSYTLAAIGSFGPDEAARSGFGIENIPAESFTAVEGRLEKAIPPGGRLNISAEISSIRPLTLSTSGLWAWIKAAAFGLRVEFLGTAKMTFDDIRVRLERDRMAGIFGVDRASSVFDFQDVQRIAVKPDRAPLSFVLETGSRRSLLLLIALLVLGAPLAYAAFLLQGKASYRVTVGAEPSTVVALRRLGRFAIHHPPHTLGSLVRGLSGGHRLVPDPDLPEIRPASATQPGSYSVSLPGGESVILTIEALDSRSREAPAGPSRAVRKPTAGPAAPAAGAEPPPPGSAPQRPAPGARQPKIRRPGR